MKKLVSGLLAFTALTATAANAAEVTSFSNLPKSMHHKHDLSAPAGVMGDHVHGEGEYMFEYSFEHMNMDGYRDGTDDVSLSEILTNYSMAVTDMNMDMHMFNLMYGVSDSLTAMIMVPYISKTMVHADATEETEMESEGLGDIKLSGVTNIFSNHDMENHSDFGVNLNFGISLPTGATGNEFTHEHMMVPETHHQEYEMQLGSGTFDPTIGATAYNRFDGFYLGLQGAFTPRFGKNNEGYRLGNEARLTGWASAEITDFMNTSLRLDGKSWGNVNGRDRRITTAMLPGGRIWQTGGERIDALVGVDLYKQVGDLGNHSLQLEYGIPIYQDLDGPQVKVENISNLTYKLNF